MKAIILTVIVMVGHWFVEVSEPQQIDGSDVKAEIIRLGIEHPDIVYHQSLLETGRYKCTKCSLDNNNLFGFYYKGKYLWFDTWQESVAYYKWWQDKLYRGGDYFEFLDRVGFATSAGYIHELKRFGDE